jgi:mannan endo-1,4-beta-mannosidase
MKRKIGWLTLVSLVILLWPLGEGTTEPSVRASTPEPELDHHVFLPLVMRDYPSKFVVVQGTSFSFEGATFRFGGTNNYYLIYKSQYMVNDLLQTAASNHLQVIRTWGFLDIGNQDGSNSIDGKKEGVYFQYWAGSQPAYNDGSDGLRRLDYVVYRAGQLGLKLTIPFVNNWREFGGMDQYVRWANGQYHDDFYSDPVIRQWYQNWISHLLNHINVYTGVAYKDDPTIMAWELANEPRCGGSGVYGTSPSCDTELLTAWVEEMTSYVKQVDPNHLVGVGDEGFYCFPGSSDWTRNCSQGVGTLAFTSVSTVDFMSFHLYPDHWGKSIAWGTQWIIDHIEDAHSLGKPVLLGEYGIRSNRDAAFQVWTETFYNQGGSGDQFWMLAAYQDNGSFYPDYDGFTVYCPGSTCTILSDHAQQMSGSP